MILFSKPCGESLRTVSTPYQYSTCQNKITLITFNARSLNRISSNLDDAVSATSSEFFVLKTEVFHMCVWVHIGINAVVYMYNERERERETESVV